MPTAAARRRSAEDELLEVLRANRWDLKRAAEQLGISRPSLYVLIEHCPAIRKAGDLKPRGDRALPSGVRRRSRCHGRTPEVSRDALHRRIRELGLAFRSDEPGRWGHLDELIAGRIGPYQILERIGVGGMGEVFLAYDSRLDRRVAIKRIRPGSEVTPVSRERFRREARLAARLSHSAIVQVYDILEEEGSRVHRHGVRGGDDPPRPGRRRTAGRARGPGAGARAGRGAGHGASPGGHPPRPQERERPDHPRRRAKIIDFGIAKRLLAESAEDSLTAQGHVLGTYRAMSPEQARGEEVDHRSDLFSFGVLLYETLTGRSPFEAENELATLNRIVQSRQTPLRKVNPAVPEQLSRLVDHLLEKDPRLRPRSAGEVGRELAPAAGGGTGPQTLLDPTEPMAAIQASAARSASQDRPGSSLEMLTGRRSTFRTAAWISACCWPRAWGSRGPGSPGGPPRSRCTWRC